MADQHQVYLGLGSNLGDRLASMRKAVVDLASYVNITTRSQVYGTESVYVSGQPRYLNAVIGGTTALEPMVLLYTIREIERLGGRMPTFKYGAHKIDIDILFYADQQIQSPELIVPHKHWQERMFVLRPMMEIAPTYVDPVTGKTVAETLEAFSGVEDIHPTGESL